MLRALVMPDYDKEAFRQANDLRNHAVDAVLLGLDLPPEPHPTDQNSGSGMAGFAAWKRAVWAATRNCRTKDHHIQIAVADGQVLRG